MTIPVPKPQPVTIRGVHHTLVAFYYPGKLTGWDSLYQAPFLGNFWPSPLTLTAGGASATFQCGEAAFQATKWWDASDDQGNLIRPQFVACADGDAAFRLRNRLSGDPRKGIPPEGPPASYTLFPGHGEGAMAAVLGAKFQDPALAKALLQTGSAYLLEHNTRPGKDLTWSDNHDGTGGNLLGILLMKLRGTMSGGVGAPSALPAVAEFTFAVQGDPNLPARGAAS